MEEARWRQPSIIVFDDLDALMKQPDPVKDAEPTIVYHTKLAEGSHYFYQRLSYLTQIFIIMVDLLLSFFVYIAIFVYRIALYCIALYCMVLYCIVLYCIVLYGIVLCCFV